MRLRVSFAAVAVVAVSLLTLSQSGMAVGSLGRWSDTVSVNPAAIDSELHGISTLAERYR